jgi:Zn-dependent M16 (insulinase) family peptidase
MKWLRRISFLTFYDISSKKSNFRSFNIRCSPLDAQKQNRSPNVGLRLKVFQVLDQLLNEPEEYWKELARTFLSKDGMFEVIMIPDSNLAKSLASEQLADVSARVKSVGQEGLKLFGSIMETAIEENKVHLPKALLSSMPPVPDVSKAGKIKVSMENFTLSGGIFSACQVVKTDTAFFHLGFGLNMTSLPSELKSCLVLFQELLFQSPVEMPDSHGDNVLRMTYQEVSKYCSSLFISQECGVGFGNSLFSVNYLSQILTLFATSSTEDFERVVRFIAQVLMFSTFTKERIGSIAKNLLSNLYDLKRDGQCVLDAVLTRMSSSDEFSSHTGALDHNISIFHQESFLKQVISDCKVLPLAYFRKEKIKSLLGN